MPEFEMNGKVDPGYLALDLFTQGYIEALFFTEAEELGEAVGFADLAPCTQETIKADCARFYAANADDIAEYGDDERAGRDFWYSRNGHGAGFFDRGLGDLGDRLQRACGWGTEFPELYAHIGDDGLIYLG